VTTTGEERFETVVIGAGQAGLAVGYHLAQRGRPFVILEANERIGDSWRRRWDSLRLFSPARYDGLPGMRFPGAGWHFPTKDEAADFVEAYARRFAVPVRTGVRVTRLSTDGDRFIVAAGGDRFVASNVVVASGAFHAPRLPTFAAELDPGIVQIHSSEYRSPTQLRNGGVLVVGAGNSGAEIALDLSRTDRPVVLSGRDTGQESPFRIGSVPDRLVTPPAWFLLSRVLTTRRSVGRWLRRKSGSMGHPLARVKPKDFTAAGVERVPKVVGVRDGHPVIDDGRAMPVSNVIWCTGFQPDYRWIDLPVFGEDGNAIHDRGVVTSQPGLYFVGLFFLHSLTSSLIGGVGRDAEHVAKHIASRRLPADPALQLVSKSALRHTGMGSRCASEPRRTGRPSVLSCARSPVTAANCGAGNCGPRSAPPTVPRIEN
jgi:putative flavoprotein involved in K+ transport